MEACFEHELTSGKTLPPCGCHGTTAAEQTVYNLGDGTISSDVTCRAEGIHSYVEGYHHGIVGVGEAEDRGE